MKENLLVLLLSLGCVFVPSLVIAIGIYLIFGVFVAPLLLSCGLIFIVGYAVNSYTRYKAYKDIETIKLKRAELESSQNVEVSCAYCKARNVIPIKLSTRNTFKCKSCEQENLIIFQFATAQVTTPLTLPTYGETNGNT